MKQDISSLRLSYETDGERFHRFVGAIEAARQLGLSVTLRIYNDPYAEARGVIIPLDVYAEVEAPSSNVRPEVATPVRTPEKGDAVSTTAGADSRRKKPNKPSGAPT